MRVSRRPIHGRQRDRFCGCHAISRATGMSETRSWRGFRRFFICPSLFRGAVPLNAAYLNSPARSPRQYEVGVDANGMVGAERGMLAAKCDLKRRISELRSGHQTKVAGRHAKRRAIHGGRGSILKCGVSGVIVPVLNFEIEFHFMLLRHWKYSAGHL